MVQAMAEEELSVEEQLAESVIDRVDKSIAAQHDPKKFRMAQWIRNGGISLARESVTVYTDMDAGWELMKLQSKITQLQDGIEKLTTDFKAHVEGPPAEELQPLLDELADSKAQKETLAQRVVDTSITFHLRAISPAAEKALLKQSTAKVKAHKWSEDERVEWYAIELFRSMIVKMELATGETDDSLQLHDDMAEIIESLPDTESAKLYQVAQVLMNAITLADKRESAGFLGGSADVGAEQ